MRYGRFIKRWIGILLALMVSVCAIACQKKGRAKDPINTFSLDLYVTTDTDEDPTRVYGVEHRGTQPQMYLYEITDYRWTIRGRISTCTAISFCGGRSKFCTITEQGCSCLHM